MNLKRYALLIFVGLSLIYACTENENKAANSTDENNTSSEIASADKKPRKPKTLGERMFIMCEPCHSVDKDEPHKVGPNLHGIFGAKAASKADYNYSEALQKSDIVWNEEHIRNWLQKPMDYIPGTTMAFVGIQDEQQQTALIEYLKEVTE